MSDGSHRLTCQTCGADLGDASDPYRDPSCVACINADMEAEADDEPAPIPRSLVAPSEAKLNPETPKGGGR